MSKTFGQYVKGILERRGLSENQLAERAEVSQGTVNNLIHGRHQTSVRNLEKMANALELDVGSFVRRALGQPVDEEGAGQAEPLTSAAVRERLVSLIGETETDHGTLIVEGDERAARDDWRQAALKYAAAYPLLLTARARIDLLVDRLAQTYINLGAYDLAALLLNHADNLVINLAPTLDESEAALAHLKSAIDEKRGWVEGYRGRFALARELFYAARGPAAEAGEMGRVSTTHHFPGRLAVESQMAELFPGLQLPSAPEMDLDVALRELRTATGMDRDSPPNVAFGLLWEGRGLRQAGDWEDAHAYFQHSLHMFRDVDFEASEAQPVIELARQSVLRGASRELGSTRDQVWQVLWYNLAGTQHPYVVAHAFTLLAYCELLLGKYRTAPHLRQQVADMCELVQRIHPHPQHPLYRIARAIQRLALDAMDERERLAYEGDLEARTGPEERQDEPLFYWLDSFLPTSKEYVIHKQVVNVLFELRT